VLSRAPRKVGYAGHPRIAPSTPQGRIRTTFPSLLHCTNHTSLDLFPSLESIIMSFSTIPILDLSLAKDPSTKPQFLSELRHALLEVGFLYLKNVGIPEELTQAVIKEGVAFFDLPMDEKSVPSSHSDTPLPLSLGPATAYI
jgi:hypothetical protein